MGWRRLIEGRIEAAARAGEFDDLPGSGQPLRLSDDENVDPTQWAALHVLKNAGAAPAWIELDRELRAAVEAARRELRRQAGSRTAMRRFRARLEEVNRMVDRLNLAVPALTLQRPHFDAEREARRALQPPENEEPA